jgi:hypothetical protein
MRYFLPLLLSSIVDATEPTPDPHLLATDIADLSSDQGTYKKDQEGVAYFVLNFPVFDQNFPNGLDFYGTRESFLGISYFDTLPLGRSKGDFVLYYIKDVETEKPKLAFTDTFFNSSGEYVTNLNINLGSEDETWMTLFRNNPDHELSLIACDTYRSFASRIIQAELGLWNWPQEIIVGSN